MQVKVLKAFRDKETKQIYAEGTVLEVSAARFKKAEKNLEKFGGGFLEKVEPGEQTKPGEPPNPEEQKES